MKGLKLKKICSSELFLSYALISCCTHDICVLQHITESVNTGKKQQKPFWIHEKGRCSGTTVLKIFYPRTITINHDIFATQRVPLFQLTPNISHQIPVDFFLVVHNPAEFSSKRSLRHDPGFGNPWSKRKWFNKLISY